MSLDFFEPITLSKVISQSDLIVVARKADPFKTLHRMIDPGNGTTSPIDDVVIDDWTDGQGSYFITPRLRYVVEEVLYNDSRRSGRERDGRPVDLPPPKPRPRGDEIAPYEPFDIRPYIVGKMIYVYPADLLQHFDRFKDSQDGISSSPIYEQYTQQSRPGDDEPGILFLRLFPGWDYQFSFDGAEEGLASRARVEHQIRAIKGE
ncbi:MAG: hypothetical protein OEZ10_07895 [Gammaproteobacteria bacterium]|nr:hypothetical protein [Gammaproteobacteria bacterium]